MAKCVRIVGQGVPVRLLDDDAALIVGRDGDGEYCSKKFFKDWYATENDERVGANYAQAQRRMAKPD